MPRPRVHDPDVVLDAAELLAAQAGPAAVTIRAISAATGVSNGAIYHRFGSRAGLLGRVWLRAAERFLAAQRDAVQEALSGPTAGAAIAAVLVAADAPAVFSEQHPTSGRFLLMFRREDLIALDEMPPDIATELRKLDRQLADLFVRLARLLWDRDDRDAIAVLRDCIVALPSALLLRKNRTTDPQARQRLSAAVRAVIELGPPAVEPRPTPKRRSSP